MRRILISVFLAVLVAVAASPSGQAADYPLHHRCDDYDPDIAWLEKAYEHFSICYTATYADDVSWVASWLTYIHWHLARKYDIEGLRAARYWPGEGYYGGNRAAKLHVSIMLLPAPDRFADTGTTRFMLANGVYDGVDYGPSTAAVRYAYIPYLTPSAPDWSAHDHGWGSLRSPTWQYAAHYLMHEYTHAVHHTIWDGEPERPLAWNDKPPWWVSEGLAEYEANAHTTAYNRTVQYQNLVRYVVETIPDRIFCCETLTGEKSISTTDAYFGGRLILYWLAEALGGDVHVRLVRHQHDTFEAALIAELADAGMTIEEAWETFRVWVAGQYAQLPAANQ